MRVRCVYNSGEALPQANIDPRRGFDRSLEFPLTVGCEYGVFAITVFLGTAWYYVLDDEANPWPIWSPSALFEVVDGALPPTWIVGYRRESIEDQYPVISFPEWANDHSFYERLLDRDDTAWDVFQMRRREVER